MIQDHGVDPPDPQLAALAFTPVGHLPEGWGAAADFTGADLTLGSRTIDGTRVLSANWRVVDSHLTVTTTFGLVELLDLLSIAKRSTPNEWMALEQRVAHLEPHGGPEVNADVDR